jgi:hypothetical protein
VTILHWGFIYFYVLSLKSFLKNHQHHGTKSGDVLLFMVKFLHSTVQRYILNAHC